MDALQHRNSSPKFPSHVQRSKQRQEPLNAQQISMLRGVPGTASWRAQQMSPQFAVDVSLLLSATAQPVVQDLLDANNSVRDLRRNTAQSLRFHSFNGTPWQQLFFWFLGCSERSSSSGCFSDKTGEHPRTLENRHLVCRLIHSDRQRRFRTGGRDFSMSTGSTESQYGQRHVNGVHK